VAISAEINGSPLGGFGFGSAQSMKSLYFKRKIS
jgi:hypothetical protein